MAKLQVRLLVLIALGTISRCQDADAPPPDGAAVIASGSAPLGCGVPKPINVRFNAFKVKGPDSDVVYQRMTVHGFHVYFASNDTIFLPGGNFVECAKAAATAGFEAFLFQDDTCNGYPLTTHFLKCQTGGLVIFVRPDYIKDEPAVVPLDEAPSKKMFDDETLYMLSGVVEADDDHLWFKKIKAQDQYLFQGSGNSMVYLENGDLIMVYSSFMDLNFCLNDGAYGLPFAVSTMFGPPPTSLYFFEQCGKTIKIGGNITVDRRVVYSHPGFGCQDYPTGLPDECIVTFEGEDSVLLQYSYGFFFPETVSDDGGLIMTIPHKDLDSQVIEIRNVYQDNSNSVALGAVKNFDVSFLRHPSKRALGFVLNVFPEMP